ncbi:phosphonate ABC transporter ATP-binding protein [Marinobacter sp. V034]|uniref:phosphonate ABC transporter ATP-binding protein n=1 Tax=Marinobacter sp. V034 TaxID=3459610 RepID=UPI004044AFFF
MSPVVEITSLRKTFGKAAPALNGVDLSVARGEMVALIGPSGSGKSTLMRHIAGLTCCDRKVGAAVSVMGSVIQREGRLGARIRKNRSDIGYIFQQFNLVNRMSVLRNVLMGLLGRISHSRGSLGLFSRTERRMAMEALARVGMDSFAHQRADSLSGGQQQRVAIARALVQKAEVILADEPIASLDPESARIVMDTLKDIHKTDGKTVIVTLHQVEYARSYCERAVALRTGELYFDGPASQLTDQLLQSIYGGLIDFQTNLADTPTPESIEQSRANALALLQAS